MWNKKKKKRRKKKYQIKKEIKNKFRKCEKKAWKERKKELEKRNVILEITTVRCRWYDVLRRKEGMQFAEDTPSKWWGTH